MRRFSAYLFKDKVFVVAMILAILSMFFIPPSLAYVNYINWKVLIIMMTIMIAVGGLYETHFFDYIATKLVMRFKSIKWIALVLILTTFFLAMFLTNDAVLLTLIPFTVFITIHTGTKKYAVMIIILQTIAANMGSALTPMGDPQNIYLYAFYDIPFHTFLSMTFPISLIGFILIVCTSLLTIPNQSCDLNIVPPNVQISKIFLYLLLLINALLTVLRLVHPWMTLAITLIMTFIWFRHLFKKVDYHLLLTFLSFFIFTGNLSQMDILDGLFQSVLQSETSVYFSGLLLSQFISNVPASVLLSTFTDLSYAKALLQGVNVGAMGTIIGSLASLISFKYMIEHYKSDVKRYLLYYSLISLLFITIITSVLFLL
ncbi:MAG: anion transporter [Tenericutes bacterium HGW-Tenericutes-6]|jgi:Na+/H+ antiporter NhaD/arsenite permease-like protein|nr:MAG: anion transporter [Tenericutes bacterium HGW-Tenericutes-6]